VAEGAVVAAGAWVAAGAQAVTSILALTNKPSALKIDLRMFFSLQIFKSVILAACGANAPHVCAGPPSICSGLK
jgi:hypothetical protein